MSKYLWDCRKAGVKIVNISFVRVWETFYELVSSDDVTFGESKQFSKLEEAAKKHQLVVSRKLVFPQAKIKNVSNQ